MSCLIRERHSFACLRTWIHNQNRCFWTNSTWRMDWTWGNNLKRWWRKSSTWNGCPKMIMKIDIDYQAINTASPNVSHQRLGLGQMDCTCPERWAWSENKIYVLETRVTNDEWWVMNDQWWMMNDEWLIMNEINDKWDEWWMRWMMNDQWWTMNNECWMKNDGWWIINKMNDADGDGDRDYDVYDSMMLLWMRVLTQLRSWFNHNSQERTRRLQNNPEAFPGHRLTVELQVSCFSDNPPSSRNISSRFFSTLKNHH